MDKIIAESIRIGCSNAEAFKMFTCNQHLEKWLTVKANVEAYAGGAYELFWEPEKPEINSTIGCKILAVENPYYLNFEWKGPEQFSRFMNDIQPLTNVSVFFIQEGDHTILTLLHTGWRDSDEWEHARQYFVKAWKGALKQLADYIDA